jgi:hypothetical protein
MEYLVLSYTDYKLHGISGSILCWLQVHLVLSYADYRNIWFYSVVITSSMEHIVISCADPWGIKLVSTAGQNWLKSWFNFL